MLYFVTFFVTIFEMKTNVCDETHQMGRRDKNQHSHVHWEEQENRVHGAPLYIRLIDGKDLIPK